MLSSFPIIASLAGLAVYVYSRLARALSRSPPGPAGVPGFGILPSLFWRTATDRRYRMFLHMQELRRSYGDVASFRMGTQEFVLVSSIEVLRELLLQSGDRFMARSNTNFHKFLFKEAGIIGSEGPLWQEHRRFALRVLKDFGFGRNASEEQIQEEAVQAVNFLRQKDGQLVDMKEFITKPVANVVTRFIFSNFSSYDDPEFEEFTQKLRSLTNQSIVGLLTAFYRFLPVETALALSPSNRRQFDAITWVEDVSRRKVEAIRSKYDCAEEPSNYVEAYLQEQSKRGSDLGTFTNFQLVKTIWDLYIAGVDTTTNTLRWCLLYAVLNPEQQERCYKEIQAKIGRRPVCLKDKRELHYCQAFLDEAQRLSTLVPMSVDHRAFEDTEFHSYNISANAMIFINLYGLHHDETHFPDPEKFDPNRFLTSEGQYKSSDFLAQFGIGKRACLGEVLARMELFLLFVTFVQNFRFQRDPAWTPDQVEQALLGTEGVVHAPGDHSVMVSSRDA